MFYEWDEVMNSGISSYPNGYSLTAINGDDLFNNLMNYMNSQKKGTEFTYSFYLYFQRAYPFFSKEQKRDILLPLLFTHKEWLLILHKAKLVKKEDFESELTSRFYEEIINNSEYKFFSDCAEEDIYSLEYIRKKTFRSLPFNTMK